MSWLLRDGREFIGNVRGRRNGNASTVDHAKHHGHDRPDLILTQDLCEVCAVSSSDESLCAIGIETLALDAHSIVGIEETVLALGARLGVQADARAVVDAMELAWQRAKYRGNNHLLLPADPGLVGLNTLQHWLWQRLQAPAPSSVAA